MKNKFMEKQMMVARNPTGFLKDEYMELVKNDLDWKHRKLDSMSVPDAIVEGKKVIMLC